MLTIPDTKLSYPPAIGLSYSKNGSNGLTFESFYDSIPNNALITNDGTPIITNDGFYIIASS